MRPPDPQRYYELLPVKQRVTRHLLDTPGVTGVDVGWKIVDGEETDEMALLVFVERKGDFAAEHEIPKTVQGVPTDVIEATFVPAAAPADQPSPDNDDTTRYNPLVGGCMISSRRTTNPWGTLGAKVKDNQGRERLLSCWHILCGEDWDRPGTDRRQVQPGRVYDPSDANVIGDVERGVLGHVGMPWPVSDRWVDCAVCDVSGGRPASASIIDLGTIQRTSPAQVTEQYVKRGARTGLTRGVCYSIDFSCAVQYPGVGRVEFEQQYRFSVSTPYAAFARTGDSGAIVMDGYGAAVGMVFAVSGGDQPLWVAANPMYMVLGALNVVTTTT